VTPDGPLNLIVPTRSPLGRYIALGKIAEKWHAVAGDLGSGRHLLELGARRRRIFTAAELALAERFTSRRRARLAGRACGLKRTYATPDPHPVMPTPDELAARSIVARSEPRDRPEASDLAAYILQHQEDHAAFLALTREQLAERLMLAAMRQRRELRKDPRVTTAAQLQTELFPSRPTRRA
jgi:hypothetical protein